MLALIGGLGASVGCAPRASAPATEPVAVESPAAPGSMAPNWSRVAGRPALTWWEPADAQGSAGPPWRLRFARWTDGAWSAPVTLTQGHEYFANWADFPSAVEGNDGALYAHWLEKTGAGTYAYGIQLARSGDGGATWSPLGLLHHDGTETEHGFVTLVPEGRGVRAVWLDGRETAQEGGAMNLRTALIDDAVHGATETLLDARICDCCSTAAVIASGELLVAYRDRSPEEIRDIALVRHTADGWSKPVALSHEAWKIAGCPVNGPVLAAHGDVVWAAWYSAEGDRPRVIAATSGDRGMTFGPPIEIDGAAPLGRLGLATLPDGTAALSWLGVDGEFGCLRLARLAADGHLGPIREVARTASTRGTGVPRIAVHAGEIWMTWVTPGDQETGTASRIEVRRVAL